VLSAASLDEDNRVPLASLKEHVEEWSAGRSWVIRLPLVAYFIYVLFRQLADRYAEYGSLLFGGITFLIHELGHVIFGFAPDFITIAGGSFLQLAVPILVAALFLRQPDFFGVTVGGFWLGYSLINLSHYVGDARKQVLPLLGVGSGEPIHDWNYLLTAVGLLEKDRAIAAAVRAAGAILGVLSLACALWICWLMWRRRGARKRLFS
jgi:hypothetical protein